MYVDDPRVEGFCSSIQETLAHFNPNLAVTEFAVVNATAIYGGRVDALAWVDGRPFVVDFKTSDKRRTQSSLGDYRQQAAAYREAILERVRRLGLYELAVSAMAGWRGSGGPVCTTGRVRGPGACRQRLLCFFTSVSSMPPCRLLA